MTRQGSSATLQPNAALPDIVSVSCFPGKICSSALSMLKCNSVTRVSSSPKVWVLVLLKHNPAGIFKNILCNHITEWLGCANYVLVTAWAKCLKYWRLKKNPVIFLQNDRPKDRPKESKNILYKIILQT